MKKIAIIILFLLPTIVGAQQVQNKLEHTTDLSFFVGGEDWWFIDEDWQQLFADMTSDHADVPVGNLEYTFHHKSEADEPAIWVELGEEPLDLSTSQGRLEARQRLAFIAMEASKEDSISALKRFQMVGLFKLKAGHVVSMTFFYETQWGGEKVWKWYAHCGVADGADSVCWNNINFMSQK